MAAAMESLPWPFKGGGNGSAAAYGDLESPHALDFAAARVARSTTSADGTFHELVFLATGPDAMSVHMTRNTLASLATVGLGVHVLLLADSPETCKHFEREFVVAGGSSPGLTIPGRPCYWSSRVLHDAPADSVSLRKFWDWRFRFYYVKKAYLSRLVSAGFSVIQADTDTVWCHDPFALLRHMDASLVVMRESGTVANAGLLYARPGSRQTRDILDEVAWRIQLFSHAPHMVGKIVRFATRPYYANSDDQTILEDVLVSAVLRSRTFLGSTAHYEAKNRHHPEGSVEWHTQPEAALQRKQLHQFWSLQQTRRTALPWALNNTSQPDETAFTSYSRWSLPPSTDGFVVAPTALFAMLPFSTAAAVTHLTASRGFASKVRTLKEIGRWYVGEVPAEAAETSDTERRRAHNARERNS